MTDVFTPGKIGVTIKVPESKRYAGDNPRFVFEGVDPEVVKQKIGATFGLSIEGLDLGSVVVMAQRHVSGLANAAHGLGGTVLATGPAETSQPVDTAGGDVWQQAAAQSSPPWDAPAAASEPADPILVAIEQAKTVDELKQLWAENQSAFNDSKYMDPWKAKGKALSV